MYPEILSSLHGVDPASLYLNDKEYPEERLFVDCTPLGDVLGGLGVRRVDLLVLDVEGAELEVLQSVDWGAVEFDVVCVEALLWGQSEERHGEVAGLLAREGFVLDGYVAEHQAMWFRREGFSPSADPAVRGEAPGGG